MLFEEEHERKNTASLSILETYVSTIYLSAYSFDKLAVFFLSGFSSNSTFVLLSMSLVSNPCQFRQRPLCIFMAYLRDWKRTSRNYVTVTMTEVSASMIMFLILILEYTPLEYESSTSTDPSSTSMSTSTTKTVLEYEYVLVLAQLWCVMNTGCGVFSFAVWNIGEKITSRLAFLLTHTFNPIISIITSTRSYLHDHFQRCLIDEPGIEIWIYSWRVRQQRERNENRMEYW